MTKQKRECATGCGNVVRDATVCKQCAEWLAKDLGDVSSIVRELEVTRTRQSRIVGGRPGRSSEDAVRLPFDPRVAPVRAHLRNTLMTCLRLLPEPEPIPGPAHFQCQHASCEAIRRERWPADTMASMAAWLLHRIEVIRHHPAGDELVADLQAAIRRARSVIDRPPDVIFAGPCDAPVGEPDTSRCPCGCHLGPFRKCDVDGGCWQSHGQATCGASLFAAPGYDSITCRSCGAEYSIDDRRAMLIEAAKDMFATATEVARILSAFHGFVTPERIRKWKERDRVIPVGADQLGRPTYRIGDIIDVLADAEERAKTPKDKAS